MRIYFKSASLCGIRGFGRATALQAVGAFFLALLLTMLLWGGLFTPAALAHSLFIFAWEEGGQICSKSYFSKKSPAQGSAVRVEGPDGQILARGVSNEQGEWCVERNNQIEQALAFNAELCFIVEAGAGHRAEFVLPLRPGQTEQAGQSDGSAAVAASPPANPPVKAPVNPEDNPEAAHAGITSHAGPLSQTVEVGPALEVAQAGEPAPGELNGVTGPKGPGGPGGHGPFSPAELALLRGLVREETQKALAPLQHALAEQASPKDPGWREILGGLGWIIGIGGFTAWAVTNRRIRPPLRARAKVRE